MMGKYRIGTKKMMAKQRPSIDTYYLEMAWLVASRTTCARGGKGCVFVDAHGHVISTGVNGVASCSTHCTDHNCEGANYPSGEGLEKCEAIHAEINALAQCNDIFKVHTVYCTHMPCVQCIGPLLNTSVKRIVYSYTYPHADKVASRLRRSNNNKLLKVVLTQMGGNWNK